MAKSVNPIFSKESQKKLAETYKAALLEFWDEHMASWSVKQAAYFIPIDNGNGLIVIDKHHIEKEFWSGYSDIGQGMSFEENNKYMDAVRSDIERFFINSNLSSIDSAIEHLKEIIDGGTNFRIVHRPHYCTQPASSCLRCYEIYRYWDSVPAESKDMNIEDVKLILSAYKLYREDFKKKLFTYLKKYGSKHIHMHSYWIDR